MSDEPTESGNSRNPDVTMTALRVAELLLSATLSGILIGKELAESGLI